MISSTVKHIGLVNMYILSDDRASKHRRAPENYPLLTPMGLRTNVSYALPVL